MFERWDCTLIVSLEKVVFKYLKGVTYVPFKVLKNILNTFNEQQSWETFQSYILYTPYTKTF